MVEEVSRRKFMKLLSWVAGITGFSAITVPMVAFFYPKELEEVPSEPVIVGDEDELPVGEAKIMNFGRYPALIIHTEQGLRAYSSVCTHFACLVKWNPGTGEIDCPCHEGYFDPLDGSVIAGPPPRALDPIPVWVADGKITIGWEEEA